MTVDDLVLFAGGEDPSLGINSDVVDIYDAGTDTWTQATLSVARSRLAGAAAGSLALFAGGGIDSQTPLDVVDIYDTRTDDWAPAATLTQARSALAATTVGRQAFFAGGVAATGPSDVVDIYDAQADAWTQVRLSQARFGIAATTVGTKAIFAGGVTATGPSDVVDIYDAQTKTWDPVATLSQARVLPAAASVGSLAYFGGGAAGPFANVPSDVLDIYNDQDGSWAATTLPEVRFNLHAAALGNTLIFAAGGDGLGALTAVVHKLNVGTGQWDSSAQLAQGRYGVGVATVDGMALFAGGLVEPVPNSMTTDTIEVFDPVGLNHCAATTNSSGCAATIGASGSASLAANNLTLSTSCVPDGVFLYFHGATQLQTPFGDGFRCTGGKIIRILPAGVASGNLAQVVLDLPSAGITGPGERSFQCWFRDPAAGGAGFNTSDALAVTFVP